MRTQFHGKNKKIRMAKPDLTVNLAGIEMRNPVMVASGTFGYGEEYKELVDVRNLGAIVLKTVTLKPRQGNPPPRLVETPAGLLNAIGLHNMGVEALIKEKLPELCNVGTPIILSIGGETEEEFVELIEFLTDVEGISGIEINLSCPNIGKRIFAQDPAVTGNLFENIRKKCRLPLIAKLSPQVTDITEIARVCEEKGADAISLINSFPGMAIDIDVRKPVLGNITGGLTGPAVKPLALKMVWDVCRVVKIPVVGMGGIMSASDAIEFLLAGAKAIAVGTAIFSNPDVPGEIVEGIEDYLVQNGFASVSQIVGNLVDGQ